MAELGQTLQSRLIDDLDTMIAGDEELTAAQLMDPVDLEARLVEARARRAEALRKRETERNVQSNGQDTQIRRLLGRTIDRSSQSDSETVIRSSEQPPPPQLTAEGRVPVHTSRMPRTTLAISAALIFVGVAAGATVAYRFLPNLTAKTSASIIESEAPSVVAVQTVDDPTPIIEPIVVALASVAQPQAPMTDAAPRTPGVLYSRTQLAMPIVIQDNPGALADGKSGDDVLVRVAQLAPEPLPKSPVLEASDEGLVVVPEPPSPSLTPPSIPLAGVREGLVKSQPSESPGTVPSNPVGEAPSLSSNAPERLFAARLGPSPKLGPVFAPDDLEGVPFDLKASVPALAEAQDTLFSGIDARIKVHYAPGAKPQAEALAESLLAGGAIEPVVVPVGFSISSDNIRYYHAEDAVAAESVAKTAFLDDIQAEVRDFTGYRPRPAAGLVEVWLSGGGVEAVAAAPTRQVAQTAAVRRDPAATRRAPAVKQGSAEELNRLLLERRVERLLRARQSR